MEIKKLPKEQVIKTIRTSQELDNKINKVATSAGSSYNSTVCLLIWLGLKHFSVE